MADVAAWWFGVLGFGLVASGALLVLVLVVTLPRSLPARFRVGALVTALKCGAWGGVLMLVAVFVFGWSV